MIGFEPMTCALRGRRSTPELHRPVRHLNAADANDYTCWPGRCQAFLRKQPAADPDNAAHKARRAGGRNAACTGGSAGPTHSAHTGRSDDHCDAARAGASISRCTLVASIKFWLAAPGRRYLPGCICSDSPPQSNGHSSRNWLTSRSTSSDERCRGAGAERLSVRILRFSSRSLASYSTRALFSALL